jgi:hypothetical protein
MYKILMATDIQGYAGQFSQAELFETMGFRTPCVVDSVQAAFECLDKRHIDAIAYRFAKQACNQELFAFLQAKYQILPIFTASLNSRELAETLASLRLLLNRTHADFSDDNFNESDILMLCRHEFFRNLLSESITSEDQLKTSLLLLRSSMDSEKACLVLDMALPDGEEYFAGRWHYGADRLEVALRNFFGREMRGMRILPSVVAPDSIRLLACPLLGSEDNDLNDQSVTGEVYAHAQDAIKEVREYLSLDMRIERIRVLPNLSALVAKR